MKFRRRVIQQDARVEAVYFFFDLRVSLLGASNGQPQMAMATIGTEGMVGAAEVLQSSLKWRPRNSFGRGLHIALHPIKPRFELFCD